MATEQVSKPPSLPPYPEMIMAAMDAQKEQQDGLTKAAISKYMESTYGELPAGHKNLVTTHLNTMKQNGDLVLVKNNYMKPGPDVPVKRGRGRPPKPRSEEAVGEDGPAKPRGRPVKDSSDMEEPEAKKVKSDEEKGGKPRGRPRKIVQAQMGPSGVEAN